MPVKFNNWPAETAAYYRAAGYWTDELLTQMLIGRASSHPDQMAVVSAGCSLTYAQLHQHSERLAQQFLLRGLQPGDTALVQLPNIAEFYLVYFALLKAGIVPVNALFSHNKVELNEYVRQIKPQLAIFSGQHALFSQPDYLSTLLPNSTIQQLVFVDDVDASVFAAANQQVPLTYLHTLLAADNADIALPELNASEVAFFQLSGGSTGTPKLIPRTHNDYLYSVRGSVDICQVTAETRYLCALPCAHNFPMSSPGALGVFYAGGTVVMAPDPSPAACFPLIEKHQITMSGLVPTALNLWLAEAADTQFDISSLQVLQVGGASLPLIIARQVKPKLECQLQQVFGMAEGLVNYTRLDDDEWTICHTQGRPISVDDEIRIVDEEDNPVPCGEVGSLLTRGPYTIRGYYQSDEHNQRAFTPDGFYRSGDRVRQTEQGCLIVSGREKDQINRGGEKIAAEEIESWLLKHTSIKQVALVAMNDAVMGERACAFVVCHDAPVKAVALRKFLREQGLADYKIPDKFEFVPDLPLTAVGKINKAKLRVLLAEQQQNAMVVES